MEEVMSGAVDVKFARGLKTPDETGQVVYDLMFAIPEKGGHVQVSVASDPTKLYVSTEKQLPDGTWKRASRRVSVEELQDAILAICEPGPAGR